MSACVQTKLMNNSFLDYISIFSILESRVIGDFHRYLKLLLHLKAILSINLSQLNINLLSTWLNTSLTIRPSINFMMLPALF